MRVAPLLVLLALLIAGCTRPAASDRLVTAGGGTGGGGTVGNSEAWFTSYVVSPSSANNDGTVTVVFSFTIQDNNTETDIADLALLNNASGFQETHAITATDRIAASEPASYGSDGWKVWTGANVADGVMFAKMAYRVPSGAASGTYPVVVRETNAKGKLSYGVPTSSVDLTITLPSVVAVATSPVNATGVAQAGTWGQWSAGPGDANAPSSNYLKLTNTGAYPTPSVVVDFTESLFSGGSDPSYTVPIDGNVQFAVWEDATGTAKPNAGTYNWQPVAPTGSVTVTFTGSGHVAYVLYRVVSMPTPLPAQTYSATFTATDL